MSDDPPGRSRDRRQSESDRRSAAEPVESRRQEQLLAVARREFVTVVRTRSYVALAVAFALAVVGFPLAAGVGGYLPLVLDLLLPVEAFVPVLAFGFGTWTVLSDERTGELDVVRTFPIERSTYVFGAYLGRGTGLLAAVLVPLAVIGLVAPAFREPTTSVLASHGTVDSPVYFVRFVALAGWYALVALALAMAASSVARSRRAGGALAALGVLALVVGLDLLVVAGVGRGVVGPDAISLLLAMSPPGAFRGLVLSTAAGGLVETGPPAANVPLSVVGLAAWLLAGLALATVGAWTPTDRGPTRD
ncbi:MAG: copper ABC transporter permease [Haloarculaceae archaeon]